ncbi:hypothetical protein PAM7066_00526 [Palleronia marisminoris]|uniref:Uncharacterized protein n=1 Tax=Palleronia marisminoris TaxID=315423 RepID=A0A1Y5RHS0_9RHOB|nr:hypothetical protein PAM7066_00526 [Palleronia marisminoris]
MRHAIRTTTARLDWPLPVLETALLAVALVYLLAL